jgi:hypothetical protein
MVREWHSVLNRAKIEAPPEEYFPFKTEGVRLVQYRAHKQAAGR